MKHKVELLAPCGTYDSFLAAVNAGADAVYLAGPRFGARAYCDNFTQEELVRVIQEAHLHQVRVYLTLNTLIKQEEFADIVPFLAPFVAAQLDGIIVQDLGVWKAVREAYPQLPLHVSTQMTVTGEYGASLMQKEGAVRVVPARELSLAEVKRIKEKTGVELETFIHGAMCYCYSGQCLMSSFLGGRSGNRGRCAQPCRLPYRVNGKEQYQLSLKDMNTLTCLPELIDAGIDSFKIEGRMKKPEYVAGVTSIYRKYIDLYERDPSHYTIDPVDLTFLSNLYIRSETSDGYYHRQHGREMVTLTQPGYNGTDENLLHEIHERYVHALDKIPVSLTCSCHVGEPVLLTGECGDRVLSVTGEVVTEACNRAATAPEITEKLCRSGNTPFTVTSCMVDLGEKCFVPVKWLNELRRNLLEQFMNQSQEHSALQETAAFQPSLHQDTTESQDAAGTKSPAQPGSTGNTLSCAVLFPQQLEAALDTKDKLERILIDSSLFLETDFTQGRAAKIADHAGVILPRIIRLKDQEFLSSLFAKAKEEKIRYFVCESIDTLGVCIEQQISPERLILGASLYHWNTESILLHKSQADKMTIPLELNSQEIRSLCQTLQKTGFSTDRLEATAYGRAPLMVTANCVKLTNKCCDHDRTNLLPMTDRKNITFPVYTNCRQCFNVIYNSLATSLHDSIWMLKEDGIHHFRMDFTTESREETANLIRTFAEITASDKKYQNVNELPDQSAAEILRHSTGGHIRRGVE